eukprot:TRINITY_DN100532_c0_g1_i1.p1 TRINITY_DN100532_c0_g1~~TRINITY_DN100532_c0_g1_i1.p1  ORF type:complete len:957 (-),score=257.01 TRINITY_DN100532_c0_g1_i1:149-3019(-)
MAWCCFELFSKKAFAGTIAVIFLIDACIAVACYWLGKASRVEQEEGASDRDVLLLFVARVVLFPLATLLALRVYNKTADASPLRKLQAANRSPADFPSASGTSLQELGQPLNGSGASVASSEGNGSLADEKSAAKALFEMKRDHTLLMKKADLRREIVMFIFFLMSTGMSVYSGLKCVTFQYDPKIVVIQGFFMTSAVFLITAEYFLLKEFSNKMTEEEGELIPVHLHPVFFVTGLKCHICDLCHESMKGPHYIAYRCRTCDFDLCPRCYKLKDKPNARGFGAQAIRKDGEQITTWGYFLRICKLCWECKRMASFAVFCLIMTQCLTIAAPKIQGNIFDGVLLYLKKPESSAGKDEFTKAIVTYLVINVLQGAFSGLKALSQELVMRILACSVRVQLFRSIIKMDIAFFDGMHTGQLTSRLTNDASQMVQPLSILLNDLVANLMLLVGGMVMAFETSWKLSILALTVVPPITYIYREYATWARKVNRSIYQALGEANSSATEAIQNIRTVRGFSTEEYETDKYDDSIGTALQHGKKNAYVAGSVNAFSTYMNLGTATLILWYGGELVCDSKGEVMSIGKLITFQLYWNMMNTAFISLGNVFNDLIRASAAAERCFSLIEAKPEVDPDAGEEVTRGDVKGHLTLEGVKFRYRTRPENLVLKGVNLEMRPGTTTAIVGKSGGGKSTLVHLLMRFYELEEGRILLDGRDMRSLSSRSVRKLCGFVSQDTQLFASSIEENLCYGLGREHTREEMEEACKAANAHDFIMETDEQYETRVGEKGVMLSGGQRQRLAIARCFLRKPKLLFLDEATSALDAENEALVQSSIEKLIERGDCTVVLIAHRLSTVINSTQIAVVHKGNIIELGPHDDLMAKAGVYANLVKRQMSKDGGAGQSGAAPSSGPAKTVQTEIDELIEEMEASGTMSLDSAEVSSTASGSTASKNGDSVASAAGGLGFGSAD